MIWLRLFPALLAAAVVASLAAPAPARAHYVDDRWAVSAARVKPAPQNARRTAVQHRKVSRAREYRTKRQRAQARGVGHTVVNTKTGPQTLISRIAAPVRFVAGQLTCAINVNLALAERGIRGTGSALAKSFLNWGRPSGPVPGAVAIYHRGGPRSGSGHVAIVAKVKPDGTVLVWNPGRRGWRLVAYRKRPIAYRVSVLHPWWIGARYRTA